jgi:hypothetical protein
MQFFWRYVLEIFERQRAFNRCKKAFCEPEEAVRSFCSNK